MQAEPFAVLDKHFDGDVPSELLQTVDFVMSGSRQVYLDGSLVITASEAREIRERH